MAYITKTCLYNVEPLKPHFWMVFVFLFFSKNPPFKIAMSRQAVGRHPRLTFFRSYVTFILQWIAFIFGRDEEEDQQVFHMQERQLSLSSYLKKLSIMPLGDFLVIL